MSTKRTINIKDYLDALVDKDGLKTEVTITLTNETLLKVILSLLVSGIGIMVIANLVKNFFPNSQLIAIQKEIVTLKNNFK